MTRNRLGVALPMALALLAWTPAPAQVRIDVAVGPLEVRIAPDAPPPPRHEFRTPPPSRDYIWIAGYWDRDGERWAWREGHWERPQRRDARWIAPVYRREGPGYRYEPGHWDNQKVVEGEDYHRWKHDHGQDRGRGPAFGRSQDHGRGPKRHPYDQPQG